MCITSLSAFLKNTIVGAWEIEHPQYGYRHVMTYQNTPINRSNDPNCMLLHIPSKHAITPDCIIDTSDCPEFLKTMISVIDFPSSRTLSRGIIEEAPTNYMITMGIYHIAILNDVSKADEVIQQIPKEKQPKISRRFFSFFQENFPDYPLLLCCFNNKSSKNASPIMVHFQPQRPDILMFNTLDAHGQIPMIGRPIMFHQTLVWGSHRINNTMKGIVRFDLSDVSETVRNFVPQYGFADKIDFELPNTDVLLAVSDVIDGDDIAPVFEILPQFTDFETYDFRKYD